MPRVALCVTLDRYVPAKFFQRYSMLQKRGKDWDSIEMTTTGAIVYEARNEAALAFLAKTNASHLLFLDNDVLPPTNVIGRLLATGRPIVGGLVPFKAWPDIPMVYQYTPEGAAPERGDTGPYRPLADWDGSIIKVAGIATGCLMISRAVFEKLPFPWFSFAEGTEDLYFCRLALAAGFNLWCDTSIECGHVGESEIRLVKRKTNGEAEKAQEEIVAIAK